MDLTLLTFFNQTIAHPLLDGLALALTIVGFAALPGLGVALLIGKHHRAGAAILAALVAGLIGVMIFQYLALRPRPEDVRLLRPTPIFPAFPSGHAAAAFSTAIILGLYNRRARVWLIMLIGASLISLSRVYLGHHYPSDLLGGAVLGATIGAASYGLIVARQPGQIAWRWLLWPQIAVAFVVTQMAYLNILPYHLLTWPLADKALHFLLFGLVAFWLNLWLKGGTVQLKDWAIPLAILLPLSIALLEEGVQHFSPFRTLSLSDLLSDLLGLIFFWWISQQFFLGQR